MLASATGRQAFCSDCSQVGLSEGKLMLLNLCITTFLTHGHLFHEPIVIGVIIIFIINHVCIVYSCKWQQNMKERKLALYLLPYWKINSRLGVKYSSRMLTWHLGDPVFLPQPTLQKKVKDIALKILRII
jgi:hypothetical protein